MAFRRYRLAAAVASLLTGASVICLDAISIDAIAMAPQTTTAAPSPDALARQILDPARSNAERDKLVADAGVETGALIRALVSGMEAGTPEEYVRIPVIWRVAVAAGRRNQLVELKSVLAASLPGPGERLRDWQAVVIGGGVISGISTQGVWPADRLTDLLATAPDLKSRWQPVPDQASKMADDEAVKTGTRYDALRILAVGSWAERGGQLTKYIAAGTHAEVQSGAIAAIGDMKTPEAGPALMAGLKDLAGRNRNVALDALLRDDSRMTALLDAVAGGRLTTSDLGDARVQKLKTAADRTIRERAEQVLR